jgi:hypothetical protein
VDIARAFTYVTEDERWQNKVVVTLILGIIPIVNVAVVGYMLDLIRNMIDGMERPLPDWDDLGGQFVDRWVAGLMTILAGILYSVPMIILAICAGITLALLDVGLIRFFMSILAIAYVAVVWMPLSIGMMRYARTRDFSHYMQITRNITLARQHMSILIVLAVFVFAIGMVFNIIGRLPCIGPLLSLFSIGIDAIVVGHLTGQAALEIAAKTKRG